MIHERCNTNFLIWLPSRTKAWLLLKNVRLLNLTALTFGLFDAAATKGSSCSKRPSKLPSHVAGYAGYIEVDKVSLCSHARGRNTAEGSQPQRRKINVTQEIFGSSETNFGGIIWMKQTPACLSHLVHIFISKPFVFLPPFFSSLVSSSGLLSWSSSVGVHILCVILLGNESKKEMERSHFIHR